MKTTIETAAHYYWGNGCDGWHLQNSENLSVIRERMPPAATEVFHYHRFAQQIFYILSGDAFLETEEESITISAGESIAVPANCLHRIANHGNTALEFLVISSPRAHGDRVEMIDYAPEYRAEVKKLNCEWLERYFRVEASDEKSLSDPEKEIIGRGGFIYFVRINGAIVGTVCLLRKEPGVFELGKMAVTEKAKGMGIGNKLISFCLLQAGKKGCRRLILYSNRRLGNAIHLYRKYGFEEVALEEGLYERADIKMAIQLNG